MDENDVLLHAGAVPAVAEPAAAPPPPAPAPSATTAGNVIKDSRGRVLTLRGELTLLQDMDLIGLVGGNKAANDMYMTTLRVAARVADIDGVPVRLPTSEPLMRLMLQQVDNEGLVAVMRHLMPPDEAEGAITEEQQAKN